MNNFGTRKYGNKKVKTSCGIFDSKAEMYRNNELVLMEKAEAIKDLQRQVKYELLPRQKSERPVYYIADFRYIENGQLIVEDVKSVATAKDKAYILKRKMFKARYPEIKFVETVR